MSTCRFRLKPLLRDDLAHRSEMMSPTIPGLPGLGVRSFGPKEGPDASRENDHCAISP
jgi:hypothetical protein